MCQTKVTEKFKTHILWVSNFSRKQCHLLVNAEKYSRVGNMTIWRMRIACRIPKATNTHSEYVMFIGSSLQQWLHERVPLLRYTYIACLLAIWQCHWVAASGTYLMYFSWTLFSPVATISHPCMSKPPIFARISCICIGSSCGMRYFFKPANSKCKWQQFRTKKASPNWRQWSLEYTKLSASQLFEQLVVFHWIWCSCYNIRGNPNCSTVESRSSWHSMFVM